MLPRRALWALALVAALTAACADPPEKEIQQARGAIDTARAAGADRYAPEDFKAAEDLLKQANDAVTERDYRLALNHAIDARERALSAAKDAADRKASARVDADRAVAAATTALGEAHARLRAAENAHLPGRTLLDAKHTIGAAEQKMQEARTARQNGDYLAAIEAAKGATPRLQGVVRELDAALPRHRR
jgi:HEPN domain-containing protein